VAIEYNQVELVYQLMKLGAEPSRTDVRGNNAMHFAALASAPMLEVCAFSYELTIMSYLSKVGSP
jgi:hypothetical protein